MITSFRKSLLFSSIFILFFSASPTVVSASSVLSIGDGDTVRVLDGQQRVTVRLACIDAPEMSQQPYGIRSRQFLQDLLPIGSDVTVRIQTKDRYGRTVAELINNQGNINQQMIRRGHAFAYRRYLKQCDSSEYLRLENEAKNLKLGVWSVGSDGIQRPWDYRSGRSQQGAMRRKYRCKDIGSWSKAQQLLRDGHSYLDRDRDGEACESLR